MSTFLVISEASGPRYTARMLIECSRCGAPLDVPDRATIVRCNYCLSSHRVQETRTLAASTPNDWRAPATWTPREAGSIPSEPLPYQSPHPSASSARGVGIAVIVTAMVIGIGAVGYV